LNKNDKGQENHQYYDDEITLKELILKIIEFWNEILRRFWIVILLGVIGALIAFGLSLKSKTTYRSDISFLLNEEGASNSNDAIAAILGVSSNIPLNKVTEIVKSARVIHNVILSKVIINNKPDYVGNHIINFYSLHDEWNSNEGSEKMKEFDLTNFYFDNNQIQDFSTKELRAISIIHKMIIKSNLSINYNDKTDIFNLSITSLNSELTSELLNTTYQELIKFYTYQTVGKPMENFEVLAEREDSLFREVKSLQSQIAYAEDRTLGLKYKSSKLNTMDLQRAFASTSDLYNKVRKNKEELEFVLKNKSPEFQILDRTFIPIVNAQSKIKQITIGIVLGIFLSILYILGSKIVRDALND
jgi:uncharacterized protein involved in exopolysaccharide biosynthesis